MDIIRKINNVALGYNQQVAVRATNRMPFDGVYPDNNDYKQNGDRIGSGEMVSALRFGEGQYVVPLRLALSSSPDDVFSLPLDPVVSVKGSNEIVKREIAKTAVEGTAIRGTVKELWTQNDWSINVSGVLTTTSEHEVDWYVDKLLSFLTASEALNIECDTLNNVYRVTHVVVESFDFPFTKGAENQSFSFSLVSDDSYDLEVE